MPVITHRRLDAGVIEGREPYPRQQLFAYEM
jgi:hypothetical protein